MRRPGGYMVITEPGKPDIERDTFTCAHGNEIVAVPAGQDPAEIGGLCKMCNRFICKKCVVIEYTGKTEGLVLHVTSASYTCTPFEKRLEAMEHRGRFLQHIAEG